MTITFHRGLPYLYKIEKAKAMYTFVSEEKSRFSNYSYRNASTGLVVAVLMDW